MILCATGHRDPMLFFTKDSRKNFDVWLEQVKFDLSSWLSEYKNNIEYTISGLAQGWDTIFLEECVKLNIPVHGYAPYPGSQYEQFKNIVKEYKLISPKYHKRCFFDRDEAMVNASDMVLALLAPTATKGGTFYTRNYALDKRKPVANFWI